MVSFDLICKMIAHLKHVKNALDVAVIKGTCVGVFEELAILYFYADIKLAFESKDDVLHGFMFENECLLSP